MSFFIYLFLGNMFQVSVSLSKNALFFPHHDHPPDSGNLLSLHPRLCHLQNGAIVYFFRQLPKVKLALHRSVTNIRACLCVSGVISTSSLLRHGKSLSAGRLPTSTTATPLGCGPIYISKFRLSNDREAPATASRLFGSWSLRLTPASFIYTPSSLKTL